jgi:hypothetical protein
MSRRMFNAPAFLYNKTEDGFSQTEEEVGWKAE